MYYVFLHLVFHAGYDGVNDMYPALTRLLQAQLRAASSPAETDSDIDLSPVSVKCNGDLREHGIGSTTGKEADPTSAVACPEDMALITDHDSGYSSGEHVPLSEPRHSSASSAGQTSTRVASAGNAAATAQTKVLETAEVMKTKLRSSELSSCSTSDPKMQSSQRSS